MAIESGDISFFIGSMSRCMIVIYNYQVKHYRLQVTSLYDRVVTTGIQKVLRIDGSLLF